MRHFHLTYQHHSCMFKDRLWLHHSIDFHLPSCFSFIVKRTKLLALWMLENMIKFLFNFLSTGKPGVFSLRLPLFFLLMHAFQVSTKLGNSIFGDSSTTIYAVINMVREELKRSIEVINTYCRSKVAENKSSPIYFCINLLKLSFIYYNNQLWLKAWN